MKVLVVDDSQIMRRVLSGVLQQIPGQDIMVIEATNGQEAVNLLSSNGNVDLVLMDWNMPTMSGIDALKSIRASKNDVPVVMVTSQSEKDRVIEAIKLGANDYLAKPFKPKDVQGKIEKFLPASQ